MTSPPPLDYAALFDATLTPYLVLTPDLVIVAMNRAREQATGTRREDLVGCPVFEAFPDNPEDPGASGVANLRASLEQVLATGEPHVMAVQRYDIPDRATGVFEERYWSPVNVPVLDQQGRVVLLLHRVQDVTDLVHERRLQRITQERVEEAEADLLIRAREVHDANQRLREVNAQLETMTAALRAQTREKDQFLATLSHELRNPLAAVRAALDVLALDAAGHPALEVLDRQGAALTRMSDDLLDAARGLTGRLVVQRRPLDLRTVAEQALRDTQSGRRAVGHPVDLRLPDEPLPVDGDPVRLSQVVANLLDNAFKYTPAEAVITVQLARVGDVAELRVHDTGPGLPADLDGSLFEAFTRGADPGRGGPEGLGLGLAVVRGIVRAHGGTVTARSGPAGGATFVVRLPVVESSERDVGGAPEPAAASLVPALRILVIDDNEDLARSYSSLLHELGHEVTVASTGESGLATAQEPFDVVLCDIALGAGIDGYEVAHRLRRSPSHSRTRLVALSGFGRDEDRARAREAGFDRYLTKPVGMDTLDRLLRELAAPGGGG